MLEALILIKQNQIKAMENLAWDEVDSLEQEFYDKATSLDLNSETITTKQLEDLKHIQQLHDKLLAEANKCRESNLQDVLEIKKGRIAIQAYLR